MYVWTRDCGQGCVCLGAVRKGGCTPPRNTSTEAGGTHPTGMYSCFLDICSFGIYLHIEIICSGRFLVGRLFKNIHKILINMFTNLVNTSFYLIVSDVITVFIFA